MLALEAALGFLGKIAVEATSGGLGARVVGEVNNSLIILFRGPEHLLRLCAAFVHWCFVIVAVVALADRGMAAVGAVQINPARPVGHWIAAGTTADLPTAPMNGLVDVSKGTIGWFDFDLFIPETGWWKIVSKPSMPSHVELAFDPPVTAERGPARGSLRFGDWVWLKVGDHRLRVIDNSWIGFPKIHEISLQPPYRHQRTIFSVDSALRRPVAPIGGCFPIKIIAGGHNIKSRLIVTFTLGQRVLERRNVSVAASAEPRPLIIDPPCSEAGDISVTIAVPPEENIQTPVFSRLSYTVFNTTSVEPRFRKGALVAEIDASQRAPDFQSGATGVTVSKAGTYRESGASGMLRFRPARDPNAQGWFAYRVEKLKPGQPYLMEVEYPDDAPRTFIAAFRDSALVPKDGGWTKYPVSIGAVTGDIWPLSNTMKTMRAIIWPESSDARVIFFNYYDGMKAAVARIRFFSVDEFDDPPLPHHQGRDTIIWYEEGDNFRSLVGMGGNNDAIYKPVDRFLRLVRASGATMFLPTVLVYGHQLYPSHYNLTFNNQSRDMTAAFLLGAQRYGLKVFPELHPRADELLWTSYQKDTLDDRLLLSRYGKTNHFDGRGMRQVPPHYNALDPDVRGWYFGVIYEIAKRYRDYPAFAGISIRTSTWSNAAFNNFVSLDWGYNREIIRRYFKDTRTPIPLGFDLQDNAPNAAERWRKVLSTTQRETWLAWRCEQITKLYRELVATIRTVRPDLKLVLDLSVMMNMRPVSTEALREAGIDLASLSTIPGLEIVDGHFTYGTRGATATRWSGKKNGTLAPDTLRTLTDGQLRPSTLMGMQYHELPGELWPSVKLGFPKPRREPWVSAALEPPPPYNRERYARLLADYDVYTIGNGGNGYIFDFDEVRDFFAELNVLPRRPFALVHNVQFPLVARFSENIAYIVNTSDKQVRANIHLTEKASILSLRTQERIDSNNKEIAIDMRPYSIFSFRMHDKCKILSVDSR